LYEMLTSRPPFQGENPMDTLDQVRHLEPVPPRRLQPRLPGDLETICLKCLRKHPLERYPSARALAADLRRFLAGQPIDARPISAWQRAAKWAKRQPAMASLAGVVILASASLLAAWGYFTAVLHTEREHAKQQQILAENQRDEAQTQRARAEALLRIVHTSVD